MKKYLLLLGYLLSIGCSNEPDGIAIASIVDDTIVAQLISGPKNIDRPLVVVVPGSGGSFIPNKKFFGLVLSGYDVLSIAYFGEKNLPKKIELVPLEYLESVVLWSKDRFPKRKVILLGISKGAEYSLAFASNFNLIDGLICYSPSSFVLPHHIGLQKKEQQQSSWSLNDKEIPFAVLKPFNDKAGKITYGKYIAPIFTDEEQKNKSRIQVEHIQCNVLLLSGKDDLVWPSTKMADLIKTEVEKNKSETTVQHVSYENCGHQFLWLDAKIPEKRTAYQSMNLTGIKRHKFLYGGTHKGTIRAMTDSRIQVLKFLEEISAK